MNRDYGFKKVTPFDVDKVFCTIRYPLSFVVCFKFTFFSSSAYLHYLAFKRNIKKKKSVKGYS